MVVVVLDNSHGSNTLGKCSPDKSLREYKYSREITKLLNDKFISNGYNSVILVPETTDISIATRCNRVNKLCKQYGKNNVVLISIHNDACGCDGKWHDARGFSCFVSKNASTKSKVLATMFVDNAINMGLTGNRCIPKEKYKVANLGICRDSNCPAVLTENLFQDNKEDVAFLLSDEGKKAIVDLHYKTIIEYINHL